MKHLVFSLILALAALGQAAVASSYTLETEAARAEHYSWLREAAKNVKEAPYTRGGKIALAATTVTLQGVNPGRPFVVEIPVQTDEAWICMYQIGCVKLDLAGEWDEVQKRGVPVLRYLRFKRPCGLQIDVPFDCRLTPACFNPWAQVPPIIEPCAPSPVHIEDQEWCVEYIWRMRHAAPPYVEAEEVVIFERPMRLHVIGADVVIKSVLDMKALPPKSRALQDDFVLLHFSEPLWRQVKVFDPPDFACAVRWWEVNTTCCPFPVTDLVVRTEYDPLAWFVYKDPPTWHPWAIVWLGDSLTGVSRWTQYR